MRTMTCEAVRDVLPDRVRSTLDPETARAVDLHLEGCSDCRLEADTVRVLHGTLPSPRPGLEARIQAAVRQARGSDGRVRPAGANPRLTPRGRWDLAAAAVVVLALGTAVIWPRVRGPATTPVHEPDLVAPLVSGAWERDDGIVAGVPVIEQLSDEQLLTLLEELGG